MKFCYFEDEPTTIYVLTYLAQHRGFFKRCWVALKYIFGYRSKYGDWEESLIEHEEANKLWELLEHVCKESTDTNTDTAA